LFVVVFLVLINNNPTVMKLDQLAICINVLLKNSRFINEHGDILQ